MDVDLTDPLAKSGLPVPNPVSFMRRVTTAAMSDRYRLLTLMIALALAACGLSGCGSINGYLATGMSDYLPQWAGGLPPDVPPRPGTAKYDEFMRERERKRLEAPPPKEETDKASSASLSAIH
jgi:hypothetical protein